MPKKYIKIYVYKKQIQIKIGEMSFDEKQQKGLIIYYLTKYNTDIIKKINFERIIIFSSMFGTSETINNFYQTIFSLKKGKNNGI